MRVDVDAVLADLREIRERFGGPDGARRLAWTPDWLAARDWLRARLDELPVAVDQDEAGNIWASLPGAGEAEGFVIIGSHIDAVPAGGWLDGALGLIAALGVVRALAEADAPPPVEVRLVDWADEEGARFGRSLLGSSAAAGTLDPDDVRDLRDSDGTRLQDALAACGIDLDGASGATSRLEGALASVELHIEQGPVLLDTGRLASAVSGTVGLMRYLVTFQGQAGHAGSTPMRLRRDALAAAASAALAIREVGIRRDGMTTVGAMTADPGVITAVAGSCEMMLDMRVLDADVLEAMRTDCLRACDEAAAAFDCTVTSRHVFGAAPAPFHPELVAIARQAVADAGGGDGEPIPSGPLHDSTEVARLIPAVMLFAQSDPPLSHVAIEDSPEAALRVAIDAYARTVEATIARVAQGPLS